MSSFEQKHISQSSVNKQSPIPSLIIFSLALFQMLAMGSSHLASLPLVRRLFSTSTAANNYAIHEEEGDGSEMEQVEDQYVAQGQ